MILIYILEFFPGKKFTFWNFSQGKSLHFGIFPREKVYILEFFPGKNNFDLHFGIFPEILKLFPGKRKRKVPKCKTFHWEKREKFQNVKLFTGKKEKSSKM